MVYLNFPDWSHASAAQPYYLDETPGFSGYHCAPELFYFAPQNKWYLIYQSGPPTYSTADDPTQPQTWTAPQYFYSGQPSTVSNWIDFWVICDTANCYLFFSGDNGNYYRSQTTVANFPNGFDTPQIIMQAPVAGDLFEASRVYSLKGSTRVLGHHRVHGRTLRPPLLPRLYRPNPRRHLDPGHRRQQLGHAFSRLKRCDLCQRSYCLDR